MIWAIIENTNNRYEVSEDGQVRSLYDNFGKLRDAPKTLKQLNIGHKTTNNLYKGVNLYVNKKVKLVSVHRLVAKAFLENIYNHPMVNHKDEDKFNNHKDNLEWCTSQHNQEHSLSKQLYSFYNPEGKKIVIKNLRKFSRENTLNHAHMYQVHLGKLGQHKGWIKFTEVNT